MRHCIIMAIVQTELKKWGNSMAVVIPKETIEKEHLKESEKITLIIVKESKNVLKETFGTFKFKKSGQQMKDELRKELYND